MRCTQALDLTGDDGRDIVKFEDGRPFLVEGEAGLGRVLQFAITADSDWTNLPKRPLFLPLLHRSLFRVLRQLVESERELNVDEVLDESYWKDFWIATNSKRGAFAACFEWFGLPLSSNLVNQHCNNRRFRGGKFYHD